MSTKSAACIGIASLLLLILLIGVRPRSANHAARATEAAMGNAAAVKSDLTRPSESSSRAHLSWGSVPIWLATHSPPTLTRSRTASSLGYITPRFRQMLEEISRDARFGAPDIETDNLLKAAGLVAAIDYSILKAAGLRLKRAAYAPASYFPLLAADGPYEFEPAALKSQLLEMLKSPQGVVAALPTSLRCADIESATRCRVLSIIGALEPDGSLIEAAQAHLESPTLHERAAAASALVSMGQPGPAAQWLSSAQDEEELVACLAIHRPNKLRTAVCSEQLAGAALFQPFAVGTRDQDQRVLSLAQSHSADRVRREALAALMGRWDNTAVRDFLVGVALAPPDLGTSIAILKGCLGLVSVPEYERVLLARATTSSSRREQLWAMYGLGWCEDVDPFTPALRLIASNDSRARSVAMCALSSSGFRDTDRTLAIALDARAKYPDDSDSAFWIDVIVQRATLIKRDPTAFRKDIAGKLTHGWREIR